MSSPEGESGLLLSVSAWNQRFDIREFTAPVLDTPIGENAILENYKKLSPLAQAYDRSKTAPPSRER